MKQRLYRLTHQVLDQSDWWCGFVDGDPYAARFVCVKLEDDDLGIYKQTTGRQEIRMYQKDMVLDITKEDEIMLRINKLYSKCKTTKHWSTK